MTKNLQKQPQKLHVNHVLCIESRGASVFGINPFKPTQYCFQFVVEAKTSD